MKVISIIFGISMFIVIASAKDINIVFVLSTISMILTAIKLKLLKIK